LQCSSVCSHLYRALNTIELDIDLALNFVLISFFYHGCRLLRAWQHETMS
jgi:hypothetical protein